MRSFDQVLAEAKAKKVNSTTESQTSSGAIERRSFDEILAERTGRNISAERDAQIKAQDDLHRRELLAEKQVSSAIKTAQTAAREKVKTPKGQDMLQRAELFVEKKAQKDYDNTVSRVKSQTEPSASDAHEYYRYKNYMESFWSTLTGGPDNWLYKDPGEAGQVKNKVLFSRNLDQEYKNAKSNNSIMLTPKSTVTAELSKAGVYNPLYSYMTEREVNDYTYLLGKGKYDEAEEYLGSLMSTLEQRKYAPVTDNVEDSFGHSVRASLNSVGNQLVGSAISLAGSAGDLLVNGKVDEYAWYNDMLNQAKHERAAVAENIDSEIGKSVYSLGMSLADFAVALAVGNVFGSAVAAGSGIGTAAKAGKVISGTVQGVMSAQATANTIVDAKKRGLNDAQAVGLGVAAGAIEAITEKFSVEALIGDPKGVISYMLKNVVTEGSEEGASYVLNTLADQIIAMDKSEFSQNVTRYMADGYDEEAAGKKALDDWLVGLNTDIWGGMASGFVLASPKAIQAATKKIAQNRTDKAQTNAQDAVAQIEQMLQGNDTVQNPVNTAMDIDGGQATPENAEIAQNGQNTAKFEGDGADAWMESVFQGAENDANAADAEQYSYETLVNKPDMKITVVGDEVPDTRAEVVSAAKRNAAKVGKVDPQTGSVSVYVDNIGKDVVLGTNGLKHSLDRRFKVNAPVTLQAGSILQNSIKINELVPQRKEADGSYVLIGAAEGMDGTFYVVRSVVNTFSNELASMDVLYAINAKTESTKKENRLRSMRPGFQGPVTDSTISITDLLDYVNRYFPDVLSESVLRHYGHTARPAGDLGKSVKYTIPDNDTTDEQSGTSWMDAHFAGEDAETEAQTVDTEQVQSEEKSAERQDFDVDFMFDYTEENKGFDPFLVVPTSQGNKTVAEIADAAETQLPNTEAELEQEIEQLEAQRVQAKRAKRSTLPLDIQLFAAKRKLEWLCLQAGDVNGTKLRAAYTKSAAANDVQTKEQNQAFLERQDKYTPKSDVQLNSDAEALIADEKGENALYNRLMTFDENDMLTDTEMAAAKLLAKRYYADGKDGKATDVMVGLTRKKTSAGRALRASDLRSRNTDDPVEIKAQAIGLIDKALEEQIGHGANISKGNPFSRKKLTTYQSGVSVFYEIANTIRKQTAEHGAKTSAEKAAAMRKILEQKAAELNNRNTKKGEAGKSTGKRIGKALKVHTDAQLTALFDKMKAAESSYDVRCDLAEFLGLVYLDKATSNAFVSTMKKAQVKEDGLEKAETETAAYALLTKLVPVTFSEKIDEYRRIALLSKPSTIISNTASNAAMRVQRKLDSAMAQVLQAYYLKRRKINKEDKTFYVGWSLTKHGRKIAKTVNEETAYAVKMLQNIDKYDITLGKGEMELRKYRDSAFSDPQHLKWLQNAIDAVGAAENWLLNNEIFGDNYFLKVAYRDTLGQIMTAQSATEVTDEMRSIAAQRALEATFKSDNAISEAIDNVARAGWFGKFAMKAIAAFKTAPSNIVVQGVYHTPAGLALGYTQLHKALESNASTQEVADALNNIAKGYVGTAEGIAAGIILYTLIDKIKLSTKRPDEEEGKLTGEQEFSLQIENKYIPIDFLQPAVTPILFGAAIMNYLDENKENDLTFWSWYDLVLDAIKDSANGIFGISMLENFTSVFRGKSVGDALVDLGVDYAKQFVPAGLGAVGRAFDPKKRDTTGANPLQKAANYVGLGGAAGLHEELNVWGEPVYRTSADDNVLGNAAINMFSPSRVTDGPYGDDELTTIVVDLYNSNDPKASRALPNGVTDDWILADGTKVTKDNDAYYEVSKALGQAQRKAAEGFVFGGESVKITVTDENGKQTQKLVTYDEASEHERILALGAAYDDAKKIVKQKYEAGDAWNPTSVDDDVYARFLYDVGNMMTQTVTDENGKEQSVSVNAQAKEYVQGLSGLDDQEQASLWAVNYFKSADETAKKYEEIGLTDEQSALLAYQLFGLEAIEDKYGRVKKSKKDQTLEVIDELDIDSEQKYRLYAEKGYSEKEARRVPWYEFGDYRRGWWDDIFEKE